eukprot:TRINITY_DN64602_c0_g1_i1.p1 TRINITY_DN64602_c0_g1~~TRINITY_DN64602_c0_g1_i1.p1  ORF type:complete len:240 (-),score=37.23 TRINITY_DN64602_c0_g1_i1:59-736(-)
MASVTGDIVQVIVDGHTYEEHAAILMVASPVFASMLESTMKEGAERTIHLKGKSRTEFESVMKFLTPGISRAQVIDEGNVDFLLVWFDEYGMDILKRECEDYLMTLACSVSRLRQAKLLGLNRQYVRCLEYVSCHFDNLPVEQLADEPDILKDLISPLKRAKRQDKDDLANVREKIRSQLSNLPRVMQTKLDGSGTGSQGPLKSVLISTEVPRLLDQHIQKLGWN